MVLQKNNFLGSYVLTDVQLNNLDTWHEKELDRASGFNAGSNVFFRDVNGYIISGATYDITNGSTYAFTLFRDATNYIVSGTESILGKTILNTYYRNAGKTIISGLVTVT